MRQDLVPSRRPHHVHAQRLGGKPLFETKHDDVARAAGIARIAPDGRQLVFGNERLQQDDRPFDPQRLQPADASHQAARVLRRQKRFALSGDMVLRVVDPATGKQIARG